MIFAHTLDKVLSGEKTQTRRINKNGAAIAYDGIIHTVHNSKGRKATWVVGHTYAVQPGRGKPAVARIRITDIRCEDVRDISWEDTYAEGFENKVQFFNTWLQMHDPTIYEIYRGYRLPYQGFKTAHDLLMSRPDRNYIAWALTFELVK